MFSRSHVRKLNRAVHPEGRLTRQAAWAASPAAGSSTVCSLNLRHRFIECAKAAPMKAISLR
jgi:hypothetical protein